MEDNDFAPSVRVDLLGPLRLTVGGSPVEVPGPKRRAVLAMLAMAGGRALTADQLVDALWPTDPPESGRSALHSHVSRLRGHLGSGAARLITLDRGYRLILGADGTDLDLARTLLANGRAAAEEDPAAACQLLRQALALWRGPALADLSETAPMATEVAGLEQLRREITDLLISCAIEAGQADDVMPLAAEAVAADPLREPAVLLLMRALAVAGEPSHALQVGRAYRRRLTAEAGLDPSAHLAEVERDIARGIIGPHRTGAEAGGQPVTSAPPVPRPANRLIGREAQLVAVRRLLSTERLVTIVGPGGVGKTRLVLEVAQRAGNAAVLPLAPVTDPAAIPHALAAALGLRELRGDVLRACIAVLGNAPTLLVVDNCEHLLPAAVDVIATVLHGCRNVTVLATSREPLGLAAECSSRLAPLPLPGLEPLTAGDVDRLAHVPSVAVFLERAARVRPGFAPGPAELRRIADIVRRLDGIPLAIELAAGRLSSFSVADLSGRLDRALDLLGGSGTGQEDRHRTLRSTIEWSYQLLSSGERRLFRHLAVFPDGLDLDDAEAVAAELELTVDSGSALAHLVEASMINAIFGERTRYRMLETLRHFGLDRLAAEGEVAAAEQHLMRWALRLTDWVENLQLTESEPEADAVLRREVPNLRTAWRLARRERLLDDAATMAQALSSVASWRDLTETLKWAEELATDPELDDHPRAAALLGSAANSAYLHGDYGRAEQLARAGLERANDAEGAWRCLSALALAELSRGAYADVLTHSLAAASVAPRPSENLGIAALAAAYAHDLDQARQLNHQMASVAASPTLRAFTAYVYGEIDNAAGRLDRAQQHYTRAIDLARSSGATFVVGIASVGLLSVLDAAGHTKEALQGYRETIDYWDRSGNWTQQWVTLRNLAHVLRRVDVAEPAALIEAAADQAPDAPATSGSRESVDRSAASTRSADGSPGRADVLDVARRAISAGLARL